MNKVKFKLKKRGVRELLKSEGITRACELEAINVQRRAGEGYEVSKRTYPERTGYVIAPETRQAISDNYKNNTLEKVIRK